jgi:hypothetical protein
MVLRKMFLKALNRIKRRYTHSDPMSVPERDYTLGDITSNHGMVYGRWKGLEKIVRDVRLINLRPRIMCPQNVC